MAKVLEEISKVYEVIVFTASHESYANTILDHIEGDKRLVHHRLYRQHCIKYKGKVHIKDLRVLGRDLASVIIVDNAPYSFASQIDNGYPIIPFYDNKQDEEMEGLWNYLKTIVNAPDVRVPNKAKFRLREITETNICEYAQYYQHTNSDVSNTEQSNESLPSFGDESPNIYEKVKAPLKNLQAYFATLLNNK